MNKQRYNALHAGLLSVIIGIIIMLPAVFSYNGMFFIRGDYTHQTVTRLITARNMLFSGSAPLWNWTNFLGTEYNSAYGNLFSFNAVCLLFPAKLMPYAVMLSLCIRWFVMGVSSYALLRRFVNDHRTALIGVLLYCFSGFAVVCLEFAAFYNSMAVFPLMLLALEKRFADDNYKYLLIPATVVNFFASAYMFIGSSVVMLVYALARFFTAPEWRKNRRFGYILLCLAEYFIGVLICGFTLFGFASTMFTTARATSLASSQITRGPIWRLIVPKYLFDELAGIFLPAASNRVTTFFSYNKWYSMQAYLPLFGFALCLAHYFKRGFKDSISVTLTALLVISFIPILNNITSFYANGYTRWWYGLTLIMIIATLRVFGELEEEPDNTKPGKHIRAGLTLQWIAVLALPALFYIVKALSGSGKSLVDRVIAVFFYHDYGYGFAEDIFRMFSVGWAVIFTAALTLVLFSKKARRFTLPLLAVLIVCYGMSFVALNNSDAPVFDALLNGKAEETQTVRTLDDVVSKYYIDEKPVNTGAYTHRIDYNSDVVNYAAVVNTPSIRCSESTVDTDAARFAEFAGMGKASSVLFEPKDNGNALRTLLSVRYFCDLFDDGRQNEIPEGFEFKEELNGIKVYENANYLPFGFAYDSYVTESELNAIEDADVGLLLHTLVVADPDEEYVKAYLPHCDDTAAELEADVSARRSLTSDSFKGDPEGFTAEFTAEEGGMVFFSIPYSEGWIAKLDGEEVRFVRAGIGFMAVYVPEGEHTVAFTYRSSSMLPGMICSAAGLALAAAYIAVSEAVKRKKAKAVESAE